MKTYKKALLDAMLNVHTEQSQSLEAFDESVEKYVDVESKHYNSIRDIALFLVKIICMSIF